MYRVRGRKVDGVLYLEMEIPAKKDPGKVRSAKWSVILEERRIEPKPGTGEVQRRKRRLAWGWSCINKQQKRGKRVIYSARLLWEY